MEGLGFGAAGTCRPTGVQPPRRRAGAMPVCVAGSQAGGPGVGPRFTLAPGRPWDGDGDGMWPEPPCLAAQSPTPAPWLWPGNGSREQRRLVAGAGSLPFLQERPRARQGAQERGSGGPARPRRIRPPASTCRQPAGAGKRVASVAEQLGLLPVPRCRRHQPRHSAAGPEVPQDTPAPRHGDAGFWPLPAAPERGRTGQSQSWGGWRAPRERTSLLQPPAPTPAMSPRTASAVSPFLSLAVFPSPSSAPAPSGCGGSRGSGLAVAGAPRASPGQRTPAGSGIAMNALSLAPAGQGVPAQLGVGAPTCPPQGVPVLGEGRHERESTGDGEPGQVSLFQEKQLGERLVTGESHCPVEPQHPVVQERSPLAEPIGSSDSALARAGLPRCWPQRAGDAVPGWAHPKHWPRILPAQPLGPRSRMGPCQCRGSGMLGGGRAPGLAQRG